MVQNIRYAIRVLVKIPTFTVLALVTLALGIGANTAIFTLLNAALLKPLPFQNPEQILQIQERHSSAADLNMTGANFRDLHDESRAFSEIAAYRIFPANLSTKDIPEAINVARVSADFFSLLRARPLLGDGFRSEDFHSHTEEAVVLSYGLWQRRFGASRDVLGAPVLLHGEPCRVAGVMPRDFAFPSSVDAWAPLTADTALPENRRAHLFTVLARVKLGISFEQAQSDLRSAARQIEDRNPGVDDPGLVFMADQLHHRMTTGVRPALMILLGAVGFVLLIACANVANLILARGSSQQRELAIRAALGANRRRLVSQLLMESSLLGVVGATAGTLSGYWAVKLLTSVQAEAIPVPETISMDWRMGGFIVLISVISILLFGTLPALRQSRVVVQNALSQGGRTLTGGMRKGLRSALATAQISLGLVLLIGAGLLIKSFIRVIEIDPGYDPSNVLTMSVALPERSYANFQQQVDFFQKLLERANAVPGVLSVAASNALPFRGTPDTDLEIPGLKEKPGAEPSAEILTATPEFFHTLKIPVLHGRVFNERDVAGAPVVLVINQTMACRFWPDENPLGKRITMKDWGKPLTGEVVGVVGDVKQDALDAPITPAIYYSFAQFDRGTLSTYLIIRSALQPSALTNAIQSKVWEIDKTLPLSEVASMEEVLSGSLERRRFILFLLATFAAIALLLSLIGIYGVVAYSVSQRTQEFGVRLALGAQHYEVVAMVVLEALKLAVVGLLMGVAAALILTKVLRSLLFQVGTTDPSTFLIAIFVFVAVTALASYVPARRITKTDPVVALRDE
jgi:putative ABC transport system permease protein